MEQTITFTELTDKAGYIFKKIEILPDGSIKKEAKAEVFSGTARTLQLKPEDFATYLTQLSARKDTCLIPTVWEDSVPGYATDPWTEYDITTDGKEDPDNGLISRTAKFFKYLNSDSISLMCFDFDASYTMAQADEFIAALETALAGSLISWQGNRDKLMRFQKISSSGAFVLKGQQQQYARLHVYVPVRNMDPELLKMIFKWAWLYRWPSHLINAVARVEPRSIIDQTVAGIGRLFFEADPELSGALDLVDIIDRKCDYYPGSAIDCELAMAILGPKTLQFTPAWLQHQAELMSTPEFAQAKELAKAKEEAKRRAAGAQPKNASYSTKLLIDENIILSSDFLTKSDGTQVSVYEILTNRDEWIGQRHFQDPIKPVRGKNKAMIVGNENTVRLKSFAHGGVFYQLLFDYDGLAKWIEEADEEELMECFGSFAAQSSMKDAMLDRLMNEVKKKTKSTLTALRKDTDRTKVVVEQTKKADAAELSESAHSAAEIDKNATQGEIAEDMLRHLGHCRTFGGITYVAEKSIWKAIRQENLAEMIAIRYAHCTFCKRASDYKNIAQLVSDKEIAYCSEWKMPFGIPCASRFLRVGPQLTGEIRPVVYGPHKEERQQGNLVELPLNATLTQGSDTGYRMQGNLVTGAAWENYTLELGCRFKLGFNPDWDMPIPYWEKILRNVMNVRCFQQAFGLALCGYLTKGAQMAMVAYGHGGTGKGTMTQVLRRMLPGGRVTGVSIEQMSSPKECVPLVESVVNIIPEVKKGGRSQPTEGFKMATGGDLMQGWRMYGGPMPFRSSASQIILMNDWPNFDSTGEEIRRRVGHFIVEFQKNHPEKIDNLDEMIAERELPGVLAWAIDGIIDYFQNGIDDAHSLRLFERWVSATDVLATFTRDCIIVEDTRQVLRSALWKVYDKWADESGYASRKLNKGQFLDEVRKRFGDETRSNGVELFEGISLSDEGLKVAQTAGLGTAVRRKNRGGK